ncbi:SusC/RagA family TonB-linked outer membrane protein [Persicitalea sp.]|uniref:SusC/RagA family TonB-linked outer membrane protein n=1 Tax=Persicitalea sp. TaxID=3100273 RepID=UPI00359410E2
MKRRFYPSWQAAALALLLAAGGQLCAAQPAYAHIKQIDKERQSQPKTVSLKEALGTLKAHYGVDIVFADRTVELFRVSADVLDYQLTIEKNLSNVLRASGLKFKRMKNGSFAILGVKAAERPAEPAQSPANSSANTGATSQFQESNLLAAAIPAALDRKITGQVNDEKGEALPGVSVILKGKTRGTTTDQNGAFSLEIEEDSDVLIFSYVGYRSREVEVGNRSNFSIILEIDDKLLNEVVVVGYGSQKRAELTSAVSSVKGKDLENIPLASVDNLLQGRAAGVQVSQSSGQPGGALTVRIRGNTSVQGGNDPLYVVDGILIQSNSVDQLADGGSGSSPLADINPNDVESIEILKDAAATSIYGARAANGVVLITTKRGKAGAPSIKFSTYMGSQQITRTISQINSDQYREYVRESWANSGRDIRLGDPIAALDTVNYNKDFYWQDALFQTAPIKNYELSVSGGQDKINYYLSAGYFSQDGILINSKYDRITARSNVEYRPTNRFTVGNTFTYSHSNSNRVSESNTDSRGVIYRTLSRTPTDSPYDAAGNLLPNNTITTLVASYLKTGSNRLITNLYGDYEILKGLRFRSSIALDYLAFKEDRFYPSFIFSFGTAKRTGAAQLTQQLNWINENTLTYTRQFAQKHNVTGLLGYSQQQNNTETIGGEGSLYATDLIPTLNAAPQRDNLYTTKTVYGIASYFARVNYDYEGKYLFSATARYDGSSRFGANNRFGFFPSASVGWRISEESFLKGNQHINDLKLRASLGKTGNQQIGNFVSRGSLVIGANYNGQGGVVPASNGLPNPDLSWESTTQWDIGLDLSLFNSRVTFTTDYYHKRTDDLLFNQVIPTQTGYSSIAVNLGSIENKGFEFEFSTRNLTGAFKWTTALNMGFNRNKVLSLPNSADIIVGQSILRVGQPIGSFYGFQQLRVFPTDESNTNQLRYNNASGFVYKGGDVEFLDANGDNVINNSDRVILGNPNPDFTGGFTNNFSYAGFDLSVFINFSFGNDISNLVRRDRDSHRLGTGAGASTDVLTRWRNPGDITDFPRIYVGDTRQNGRTNSSYWLEDGSFARLKTASLGYTLPVKLISKIAMKSARLYVTGQNLLTFSRYSGFDPETVNTSSNANGNAIQYGLDLGYYPIARSVIIGINVGF